MIEGHREELEATLRIKALEIARSIHPNYNMVPNNQGTLGGLSNTSVTVGPASSVVLEDAEKIYRWLKDGTR